ncbi:MAG: cytochrome c maturation protein CcmE [Burkholderiales bacterium]|nr:cytochrome c maturation protein CcmE [Burkholderiales bacterium]
MKPRHKKLVFILIGVAGIGIIVALVMNAFRSNLVFFFTPSQVIAKEAPVNRAFRIGGLVEKGSLRRENDGLTVHFVVTDTKHDMNVTYKGILPDLFKEGKGVVAQGRLDSNGRFVADEVLAKHDENYMPPEVANELKAAKASKTPL